MHDSVLPDVWKGALSMGVYIKGFPLPNNCGACPLRLAWCRERIYMVNRPDRCPLVPAPPHGDLIDYDFCMKNYELLHDDDGNPVYAVRMRDINIAPTIIPAEPGGEETT